MTDNQKPKIVVLCGSSRFVQEMAVCAWILERDEGAIAMGLHLLPWWYPDCPADHLAEHEGVATAMDQLHRRKIDLATEVFVVDIGGYIGDSTRNEIAYAKAKGLPIRQFTTDAIGHVVIEMRREADDKDRQRFITTTTTEDIEYLFDDTDRIDESAFARALSLWTVVQDRTNVTIAEAARAFNATEECVRQVVEGGYCMMYLGEGDAIEHDGE